MKPLVDRIKYMNRPQFGTMFEASLFKRACVWIGQNPPENWYFQCRLQFNRFGYASTCLVEVLEDGEKSLGTYDILETKGGLSSVLNFNTEELNLNC